MFPSPSELLPHTGPAVLLDRVLSHEPTQTTCLADVSPTHPYVAEGRMDAAVALELIAQAVAVHGRLSAQAGSASPARGYVVGAQRLELWGGDYSVGDRLEIQVKPVFHQGAMSKFEGTVTTRGEVRARGDLSVFVERAEDTSSTSSTSAIPTSTDPTNVNSAERGGAA